MGLYQRVKLILRAGTQFEVGARLSEWQQRARMRHRIRSGSIHESDFGYFVRFAGNRATFIDIGANFGQSIASFKAAAPDCIIHSFEPSPFPFSIASEVAQRYQDVHLERAGVGASYCFLTLHIPNYGSMRFHQLASTRERNLEELAAWLRGVGYTYLKPGHLTAEQVVVPILPLDSLRLSPNAIKIDVEGAEVDVIKGSLETIERSRPILLVEGGDRAEVRELLQPLGYKSYLYDATTASLKAGAGDPNTFLLA